MRSRHLQRVREYAQQTDPKLDALRVTHVRLDQIREAEDNAKRHRRNKGYWPDIEKHFSTQDILLDMRTRTMRIKIDKKKIDGEEFEIFGDYHGHSGEFGQYLPDQDKLIINATTCIRNARNYLLGNLDVCERAKLRLSIKNKKVTIERLVKKAIRATKTPNLEDHRIMTDLLDILGPKFLGEEIEKIARNMNPEEVFEELIRRNMRITAIHELRHRRNKDAKIENDIDEELAYLSELRSNLIALGLVQLPINRNRLKSQNPNQGGAERVLRELSGYFGIYQIRDQYKLVGRIMDIVEYDPIIWMRATQTILDRRLGEIKGDQITDEEIAKLENYGFLEGKTREYFY